MIGLSSIVHSAISRKELGNGPGAAPAGDRTSTIVPESTCSPVLGSWNVEPSGSTMNWPTRPLPQPWIPSTWSCQKMLSSCTSGYQRYWTNSVPAPSPAAWSLRSGSVSVSVFAALSMEAIWCTSMDVSAMPTASQPCSGNFSTLVSWIVRAPAVAAVASVGSTLL